MGNDLSRKARSSRNKGGNKETKLDSSESSSRRRGRKSTKKEAAAAAKVATAAITGAKTKDAAKSDKKVTMDSSAVTLGDAKINARRDQHGPVMITDTLSDVRVKYHINPKEIGHGHYGVVRKCMDRETKVWYAIKSIRKSKVGKIEVLKREVALLKECEHPNIIQLVEVHEDQKYLHLITELCTGGELFDRIIEKTQSDEGHFSERDAADLVRCILDAIAYCHDQKGIVHRDLKPENFLFSSEEEDAVIKIIDFGLSRHDDVKAGIMNTKVGTPYYVAPEVLNREYTKNCDIWSIGVITYILLCGYPPFYGDTDNQIFDSVRTGRFDFPSPDWDDTSKEAKNFIGRMLKRDPTQRLGAAEALQHPWIVENTRPAPQPRRQADRRRSSIAVASRSVAFIKYRDMQKLKKSALGWLATNSTNDDIEALKGIFKKIDVNNDGTITLEELDECLKDAHFSAKVTSDLKTLRRDLSVSKEDSLNWRDFIALMMDKNLVMKEDNLRMVFDHFKSSDQDHITISDIVDLVGGSEQQAMDIMKLVDENSDGRIDFNEFRQMMADENLLGG